MQPVALYEDVGYAGIRADAGYGTYSSTTKLGMPERAVSSLKVAPFTRLRMFSEPNYGGTSFTVYGPKDIPNLWEYVIRFEDQAASIAVDRLEPTDAVKAGCCTGGTPGYSCGEFQAGSPTCGAFTTGYCSKAANIGDPMCKTWCRSNTAACDSAVIEYCRTHPGDPYCSCLVSPANVKNIVNPKCVDAACISTGYTTTTMAQTACPSIVTCDAKIQLGNSGVQLGTYVPVQQNCGSVIGVAPDGTPILSKPTTTYTAPPANPAAGPPLIVWLFIMFVVAMVIMGAAFLVRRQMKNIAGVV